MSGCRIEWNEVVQFSIANLGAAESSFEITSSVGVWQFERFSGYDEQLQYLDEGMCANTYYATLDSVGPHSSDVEFGAACYDLIDACLVLSFLSARCVTPSGSTAQSEIKFLALGDNFIRPRSIVGFPEIAVPSMASFFSDWKTLGRHAYRDRTLRRQLCHWLSGLTCFSLEDIYLACGVQMDVVKQCERRASRNSGLTYFQGMLSASTRYGISPLSDDYKKMRNDIVHEGVLSGTNFPAKNKADCASVIADTLNWLDSYVLAVIGNVGIVSGLPRWTGSDLDFGLATISLS